MLYQPLLKETELPFPVNPATHAVKKDVYLVYNLYYNVFACLISKRNRA